MILQVERWKVQPHSLTCAISRLRSPIAIMAAAVEEASAAVEAMAVGADLVDEEEDETEVEEDEEIKAKYGPNVVTIY